MNNYINDHFLLEGKTAIGLYESVKDMPVIDFHNHLDPDVLLNNQPFRNITQLWVAADPYKHRAMRINGIPEECITGESSDYDKFYAWAKTFPKTLGNPLYHWTCLELKRFFDVDELLSPENAERIWNHCNNLLDEEAYLPLRLLQKMNVSTLCTSDDLLDVLTSHKKASGLSAVTVLPSLRGDSIINVFRDGFKDWKRKLEGLVGFEVIDLKSYEKAINLRLDDFGQSGCLLADHALDTGFVFLNISTERASLIFDKALKEGPIANEERTALESYLLSYLGKQYAMKQWTLQLHIGAQRYTSSRLRKLAGSAGGYAAIGHTADISSVATFLDNLEQSERLPKVILYTLNPADNAAFASLTGSYSETGIQGKIQFGPAWWFNDHLKGMEDQLTDLGSYGLLAHFIGMTTDSRSILSFSRHEYFRRVLSNLIGSWVDKGHLPAVSEITEKLVQDICFNNAYKWLNQNKYANEK